jgi:dTDP-4-dehydrorhamnose reductase
MLLLVGGDSEIGAASERLLRRRAFDVAATTRRPERVGPDRPFLDLSAAMNNWTLPPAEAACICAAVARVAACEADPAGSAFVNVEQTLAVIDRLLGQGTSVVFLSTDKVFDGSRPLVPPDAPTCPATAYGRQKAQVEAALRERIATGARVAILRLAKVVSADNPLLRAWVTALRKGEPVRAFHDMTVAPVPIEMVTNAIAVLLGDRARGVFQLSGPRDLTYVELALELARKLAVTNALVEPTSACSAGLPPAATPRYTSLDSRQLRCRYGLTAPDIAQVLDAVVGTAGCPSTIGYCAGTD